jgi:phosphatidylinositol-3-phosphatase
MENKAYDEVIGNASAPFENHLARRCGLATDYHAVAHPSLPNYIGMTSGSTQGITDDADPSAHQLAGPSLFSQLGSQWRSLQESMPVACDRASSGSYAVKHNPAAYFLNVSRGCKSQDVPLGAKPDISSRFTFVTPNLCHDMHDCPVSTGDSWLSTFLPKVLASAEYRAGKTAIFLTYDEDDGSADNHVATLVIAPTVPPGTRSSEAFTHFSLLRTTEEILGQGKLGAAVTAPSMRKAFRL